MADSTHTAKPRPRSLARLIPGACACLERARYHPVHAGNYRATWRAFRRFLQERGLPDRINDEFVAMFLESRNVPLVGPIPEERLARVRRGILALHEFAKYGSIRPRRVPREQVPIPKKMAAALGQYETYCVERRLVMPRSMRGQKRILWHFFHFLDDRGVRSPTQIGARDISAFMRSRCHLHSKTVHSYAACLRSFFRVAHVLGLVRGDLASEVPRVRFRPHETIPSVWPREQVDALLRAIDRGSPVGKRDFAILMLAARLGMRVGDIRELKLQDIDWHRGCLSYRQSKTGKAQELPLGDEIAEALIDYLRSGRPRTEHREVFVRAHAPFVPFGENQNLWHVVTKYRRLAGIPRPASCHRGLHSLRHTLASSLLAEGVPLETIGTILGHATIRATHVYTAVDVEALRTAALSLVEVADG